MKNFQSRVRKMQTIAYSMLFYSTAILVRNRVLLLLYKPACVLGLCQTRRLSGHGHHSQD